MKLPSRRGGAGWAVALLAWHALVAMGADTIVTRPAELRADRYVDAPSLRAIDGGTHVELLRTEAGWVQIRVGGLTGWVRATSMAGDSAATAPQARLETGRSASGNIVVAAGIRRIPKASRHALIIGVESAAAEGRPTQRWPGVGDDVESARMIARRIGVPEDNIEVVQGSSASAAGIGAALEQLGQSVQPGDQVLVYFSGPGISTREDSPPGRCIAALVGADGVTLSATDIAARLQPVFANADKVLMISDAAYADAPVVAAGSTRKVAPGSAARRCALPDASAGLPLVEAAAAAGAPLANVVHIQAGAGPDQGVDQSRAGGILTQALADCVLGDATDTDQSSTISAAELTDCVNRRRPAGSNGERNNARTALAVLTGNGGFNPLVGVVAPSAAASTPGPTVSPASAIADVLAQSDGRIRIELAATPSTLEIGKDFLELKLTSSSAGYVYLILLGSDEKSFYLLFPNELDRDNRIAAGETLRLPRPSWRVQSQGPAGHDVLLAVVAESERDLKALAGRTEGPFSMMLTNAEGRAELQWLLGRSARADTQSCVAAGRQRNLAAVKVCSDAFGAARIEVIEH